MNESKTPTESVQIKVKFDESKAIYASQALVQITPEELFLDFSSGIMQDPTGAVMPIHTRIAMSHAGATRLLNALNQTLQRGAAPARPVQVVPPESN